jgi:hypothetical protein
MRRRRSGLIMMNFVPGCWREYCPFVDVWAPVLLSNMELVAASEFAPCGGLKLLKSTSNITIPGHLQAETVSGATASTL